MSCNTCRVSSVMCHMSHVTFHVSEKEEERKEKKSYKVLRLVGGGSVIDGATSSSFLEGSLHNSVYA